MSAFKEAREFYKNKKIEERNRKLLINSKTDFQLLEQLIQKINNNPNLKIEVNLADGTRLILSTYRKQKQTVYGRIDGEGVEYL